MDMGHFLAPLAVPGEIDTDAVATCETGNALDCNLATTTLFAPGSAALTGSISHTWSRGPSATDHWQLRDRHRLRPEQCMPAAAGRTSLPPLR